MMQNHLQFVIKFLNKIQQNSKLWILWNQSTHIS